MTNLEIIKNYFLPLLLVEENEDEKEYIQELFKNQLINSQLSIIFELGKSYEEMIKEHKELLKNLSFEQALDKYANLINEWNPEKTLMVFWIEGISTYTKQKYHRYHSYDALKEFYKKYKDVFFNELNTSITNSLNNSQKELYKDLLLNLVMNHDLTQVHYKQIENDFIEFYKHKKANIDDFKIFFNIGEIYDSSLIWKNYLEFFSKNQIFIHSVKKYFTEKAINYVFKEETINLYMQNKFTRTLYINPEFISKHNENINQESIDKIMKGLYEYFLILAGEIEEDIQTDNNDYKNAHIKIMIHFNNYSSLELYEKKIQALNKYLIKIISNIIVEEKKDITTYTSEIAYLYKNCVVEETYNLMESKYQNKQIEKRLKI